MTNRMPTPPEARKVIVGVDTHKHVHVAVAIDRWGIRLRDQAFVADSGGYQALITWAETHGRIEAFGVEGTGSYGAGLARAVRRAGHRVVEVNRGDRRTRRAAGKSDTIDAEVAARSVLAGQSTAIPKTADRSGPRNLDSGLSAIFIVFQAAVPKLVASKYTTSRRPPTKCTMTPSPVVELQVAGQPGPERGGGFVCMEIHILVFDAAPETLDEHVVDPASLAVHADGHRMGFEHRRQRLGRALSALVRIEDRRRSVVGERVLEGLDTAVAVDGV